MSYFDYELSGLGIAPAQERRLVRRDVDEFMGLCRAFAADGVIQDVELTMLEEWITHAWRLESQPLVDKICSLARRASVDPTDHGVRTELLEAIGKLTGGSPSNGKLAPTSLPLTNPLPPLEFQGRKFCLTGTFNSGTRAKCEQVIHALGGLTNRTMVQCVDYLVIGATATDSWLHSSYGRKIQDAVHWRDRKLSEVAIVPESHWVAAVKALNPSAFD